MKTVDRYQLVVFLVLPFLLSWPAWFNGQPFMFPDTSTYIKGAARAAELLVDTRMAHDWLGAGDAAVTPVAEVAEVAAVPGAPAASAAATAPATPAAPVTIASRFSSAPDKGGVISGRSIYYGLFIFATACLLGLQGVALLQALLATAMISSFLRARYAISYRAIAIALVLLAVASPLPYFNSMLMPDVFAGLGIVAAIALLLMPKAPGASRLFWAMLTLAAVLFHSANIMIMLATIVTLVALWLVLNRRDTLSWQAVALALALVATGIGGEAVFTYGVQTYTGTTPIRPPFMTARLLADGPGNDFVKYHCKPGQFEVCSYPRDFTIGSSDDFLWSQDPAIGVFTLVPRAVRGQLGRQDFPFAKAVFMRYPARVLENSARNIAAQLGYIGLTEFVYDTMTLQVLAQKVPAGDFATLSHTRAARGTFNVAWSTWAIRIVSVAALLVCLKGVTTAFRRGYRHEVTLAVALMLSLLINAGVCGALSTPHDRYQARVIWILELMAMMMIAIRMNWVALKDQPVQQSASVATPPGEVPGEVPGKVPAAMLPGGSAAPAAGQQCDSFEASHQQRLNA